MGSRRERDPAAILRRLMHPHMCAGRPPRVGHGLKGGGGGGGGLHCVRERESEREPALA